MNQIKVVLPVKVNGNTYLYDDASGIIHQWSNIRQEILELYRSAQKEVIVEKLKGKYSINEINDEYDYIDFNIKEYGAFFRECDINNDLETRSNDEILKIARLNNSGLLISLTDACNLRCKYCVYSESYGLTKNKSQKFLSLENAIKGVEKYFEFIEKILETNPRKTFTISFYGGEPLLNYKVMFSVIEYVNNKYPGKFVYNVTTNGILLSPYVCEKLVEYKVNVFVSLDGPQDQHDRLRVDEKGKGSYERIIEKLLYLKEKYPQYYQEFVSVVSVYDLKTDLFKVQRFFDQCYELKLLPPTKIINQVIDTDTTYYEQFTSEDYEHCYEQYSEIKGNYFENISKKETVLPFTRSLIGMNYLSIALRKRYMDVPPERMYTGNSCFPGTKIFLDTNGDFGICERVNGSHPIGNIYEGIDANKIRELIESYTKMVLIYCRKCPVSRLCGNCFRTFEKEGSFEFSQEICQQSKKFIESNLQEFIKLGTINPKFSIMAHTRKEAYFIDEYANV